MRKQSLVETFSVAYDEASPDEQPAPPILALDSCRDSGDSVLRSSLGNYRYSGYSPKDDTVTKTEWIGPFGSARDSDSRMAVKSSLDFSRLIVVLLTMNFLPAVLLWRHDEVVVWLERQKRNSVTIDRSSKNEIATRARARREVLFSLCVVVVSAIGLLALGFFTDSKQRAVPQDVLLSGNTKAVSGEDDLPIDRAIPAKGQRKEVFFYDEGGGFPLLGFKVQ